MKKQNRRKARNEKIAIAILAFALLVAMSVQIVRLKQKEASYVKEEEKLQAQISEETQRAEELKDREAYMQTMEFVEDIAKSKLGLAYENEIIFKESDD